MNKGALFRIYILVRKPRNFLKLLCIFIFISLSLHWFMGYDQELGATNLILSIEATIAGAVLMMVAEESSVKQEEMLNRLVEVADREEKMLKGVLLIAEAQREMLLDHACLLNTLKESDERLLKILQNNSHSPD